MARLAGAGNLEGQPLGCTDMDYVTCLGVMAAALTSLSYWPQVVKAWPRGSTDDLSLTMLIALSAGLLLWVGYGLARLDWVIVTSNALGAVLALIVLSCKIRDLAND